MNIVELYSLKFFCSYCDGPIYRGDEYRLYGSDEKECLGCMEEHSHCRSHQDALERYDDWAVRRA